MIFLNALVSLAMFAPISSADKLQMEITGIDSLMCNNSNECLIIPDKGFDRKLKKGKKCSKSHIKIDMKSPSGQALFDIAMAAYLNKKKVQIHVLNYKCDGDYLKLRRLRFL